MRFFNSRPLVNAAFGFCAGILLCEHSAGRWDFYIICLFSVFLILSYLFKQKGCFIFLLSLLLGILRMRLSEHIIIPPFIYSLQGMLYSLRMKLIEATDLLFYDNAPLLRAMLWGDKTLISPADIESFRISGVAHILALSGLHVSFFAAVLMWLIPASRAKLRFVVIGIFLLLYCAIAAFPPSLMRASLILLCVFAASVFLRRPDAPSSLSLAAIFILLFDPLSLFDIGFQLSFAAAGGIAMLRPQFLKLLRPLPRALSESIAITGSATLATLPLSMFYFKTIPVYVLIANLFLVPLVPFCIVPAFAAVLLQLVFPLAAKLPAFVAYHMTQILQGLTRVVAAIPYACISLSKSPNKLFVLLCYLVMLATSQYFLAGKRYRSICLLSILFLMCASLFYDIILI